MLSFSSGGLSVLELQGPDVPAQFPYLPVNGNCNTLLTLCPLSLLPHLHNAIFVINITYIFKHNVLSIVVIRLHIDVSRKMSLSHDSLLYTFNNFLCTVFYSVLYDKKTKQKQNKKKTWKLLFAWKCIYPYNEYICKLQSSTRLCPVHVMGLLRQWSDTTCSAPSHHWVHGDPPQSFDGLDTQFIKVIVSSHALKYHIVSDGQVKYIFRLSIFHVGMVILGFAVIFISISVEDSSKSTLDDRL